MERSVIVGLGNPGPTYAGTRHNVGHLAAECAARRAGGNFRSHKAGADTAEGQLANLPVTIAKLRCFMNVSGGPTAALLRFYHADVSRLTVIHDDLDLPFGTLRLKRGGGEGGHNGLKSISAALGSREYYRVRVGIGRPPGRMDPADYVLREFTAAQRAELPVILESAIDALEVLLTDGLTAAQNRFN